MSDIRSKILNYDCYNYIDAEKKTKFEWSDECEKCFRVIKKCLVVAPKHYAIDNTQDGQDEKEDDGRLPAVTEPSQLIQEPPREIAGPYELDLYCMKTIVNIKFSKRQNLQKWIIIFI